MAKKKSPNYIQPPSLFSLLLRRVMLGLVMLFIFGLFTAVGLMVYFSKDLPDHNQLNEYHPATMTRLYAADGELIEEYAKEKRVYIPISATPQIVRDAFIAAEDRNFFNHSGIDFPSIMRAAIQNIDSIAFDKGNRLVGASTITQQVAKNILLSNERTLGRKIREAILAFRMTMAFSKERILELYLNEIYLGAGSYGIAAASMNYFNKSVNELTIEEAALLAAMPKAPSAYDPRHNYKRARERRDWVIDGMLEERFIGESQAKLAKDTPINLQMHRSEAFVSAPFFAEEVRRWLLDKYGEGNLYGGGLVVRTTLDPSLQQMGQKALRKGLIAYDRKQGFRGPIGRISLDNWKENLLPYQQTPGLHDWQAAVVQDVSESTIAVGLQDGTTGFIPLDTVKWAQQSDGGFWKTLNQVVKEGDVIPVSTKDKKKKLYNLEQVPGVNGGLVAMDPHTGRVLAMVGGYTFAGSQFNRVTQAQRQPGSSFKPFVYLAALEKGFTPAMLILDEPIEFRTTRKRKPGSIDDAAQQELFASIKREMEAAGEVFHMPDTSTEVQVWSPQNYSGDFYGLTTLRSGLENSRNVMTVRLGMAIGINTVADVATRFGIYSNPKRNMSTVLGADETTLMKLVQAYATLVNGGKRVDAALVERIQDRNGTTIFRRDNRACPECRAEKEGDLVSLTPPTLSQEAEQLTDPHSAYQIVSMLEGVVLRGTGRRAREVGKPLGGKTGTTNNSMDAWFVGFSPDLVVGVFVGFDNPRTLGKKETGSSISLPIFIDFMKEALKDKPATPFRIPSGMKIVKIDAKTGFLPTGETPRHDILFEAFKPGTEPTQPIARSSSLPVVNSLKEIEGNPDWYDDLRIQDAPVTRGTGGIY